MKQRNIVIKLGTSVLTQGTRSLNRAHMLEIVRQCVDLQRQGHRVMIVSSGAIAAGREHLGYPDLPPTIACKQMLAAVGQSGLIQAWETLFGIYGIKIGQILLTRADLEDRERFVNARDVLVTMLDRDIIPIINENDALAVTEIRVGDNDNLSALAAILAKADLLVLLTDQDGLYTADPRSNPSASLISRVDEITDEIRQLAGGAVSGLGTGGMSTKIQAADVATRSGISVIIASGSRPEVIADIAAGKPVGTYFAARKSHLGAHKRWIFGAPQSGSVVVDKGAQDALLGRGSSLLPKGIHAVQGAFGRGEVIRIIGPDGVRDIGHGVSRYGSDDLMRIMGRHSDEIVSVLGYEHGPVVVHRDELITF